MNGLGLIVGHLLGDYVLQNDWMAANKTATYPGKPPTEKECEGAGMPKAALSFRLDKWASKVEAAKIAPLACTAHCLVYALCVWACSFWWMPWWGLLACFLAHWPIDRWRLARKWMDLAGQKGFATGPLAPWSIIVVDNTFHLLTLFLIGTVAG